MNLIYKSKVSQNNKITRHQHTNYKQFNMKLIKIHRNNVQYVMNILKLIKQYQKYHVIIFIMIYV